MIRRLLSHCIYRSVRGLDISVAVVGDDSYLLIDTGRRWWKRVVEVRVDRGELLLLAEQIREAED